ncbi:putative methyltransferase [Trypanosoma brucei equiperdum]|uniref:protein-histidine N-methyltransferase n=1 Tax=Trypanosoma brucei equiperdum TaxID=630700 RepID=A0A3L6L062_9TRYP|nr:putative methyltransferase [Trypanosoma brucei equiperdum]
MLADGFRFAFSGDVEESIQTTSATHTPPSQGVSKSEKRIPLLEAPVHNLTRRLLDEWCEPCRQDAQELVELHCSESTTVPQLTHQRPPRATELTSFDGKEHRDIIPGKYYGGLKIWSCAPYLVEYMFNNRSTFKDFLLGAAEPLDSERVPNAGGGCRHTIVVELGCGQGLPGIAALLLGAHHVIFQDYNEEVLQLCVKPNVGMNLLRHIDTAGVCRACESCSPVVQLVAGDWDDMCWRDHTAGEGVVVTDDRRILVLGSDVTFDEEACYKLARLLRRMLSTSGGAAYIASKQYYFGTNGGVVEFKRCCAEVELQVLEVDSAGTGGGLQRVILRVECKR